MKKIISLLMALVMLFSISAMIPTTAFAEEAPALTETVAADKFVKTYKAMYKLYRTCIKSKKYTTGFYPAGDPYIRYQVTAKKFNSKKKVMTYLKKHFSKKCAAMIYKNTFSEKNGKLYATFYYGGYDSSLVTNDLYVSKIKSKDGKKIVTFNLTYLLPDDNFDNESKKLPMVYERGKWVFDKHFYWNNENYAWDEVITPNDGQ